MSIVIKTDNKDRFGVRVTLPGVGNVKPDPETGEFETEDEEGAQELIQHISDFYIKGSEQQQEESDNEEETGNEEDLGSKSEEDDLGGTEENDFEENEELSEEDKKEIVDSLPNKTRKELEDMCKLFPSAEWRGKNKQELIEYITSKL